MTEQIELVIEGRRRDLGGFEVRRVLPSARRKLIGPFIFFDHMGPAQFSPGEGIDVRPHPHINLATVTYLFDGEILHRDSLGCVQAIRPGDVNWMTAGRGIVHSERTGSQLRAQGHRLHGIQSWVALPRSAEEVEPSFHHHPAADLPTFEVGGVPLRLIAGAAYGERSPVTTLSDMFYLEARIPAHAALGLPGHYAERGIYVVDGLVSVGGQEFGPGSLVSVVPEIDVTARGVTDSRVMLLGGSPMEGERFIWWNFVSSSRERLEQAKLDWAEGRFDPVPGETEFIPLPDS